MTSIFKKNILVILLLVQVFGIAQQRKIDSIYKFFKKNNNDTIIIKEHISLCHYFQNIELYDSAIFHGKFAVRFSKIKNYSLGEIRSNRELGNTYIAMDMFDSSIISYKNAILKINNLNNNNYFECVNGIGNAYFYMSDFINAYDYYLKYLNQAQISGTPYQKAKGNSNVGIILKEEKKYDKALVFFNKTIQIGTDINNFKLLSMGYCNIANIYNEKAKVEKKDYLNHLAIDNYKKALNFHKKLNDNDYKNLTILYGNIGNAYGDLKQYNKAIETFEKVDKIIETKGYFPQAALIYNNLTSIYLEIGNIKMVEKYIKIAKDFSIKSSAPDNLSLNHQNYSAYYEVLGDYKNALKNYKLYKQYNDTLFNVENTERRKELELKAEFEKKESINKLRQEKKEEIAKREKQKQIILRNAFSIGFTLMLLLAFFIFNGLKKQRKANKIISQQKQEVELQKQTVEQQKQKVEKHQKEIIDSINYASRIQRALLPNEKYINKNINKLKR